jgi:hypothetical protein
MLSIFAAVIPSLGSLYVSDILIIWLYVLITLMVVDWVKYGIVRWQGEQLTVLADAGEERKEEEGDQIEGLKKEREGGEEAKKFGKGEEEKKEEGLDIERGEALSQRTGMEEYMETPELQKAKDMEMKEWKYVNTLKKFDEWMDGRKHVKAGQEQVKRSASSSELITTRQHELEGKTIVIEAPRSKTAPGSLRQRYAAPTIEEERHVYPSFTTSTTGNITFPSHYTQHGSWFDLRRGNISAASLRPHVPATRARYLPPASRERLRLKLSKKRPHSA